MMAMLTGMPAAAEHRVEESGILQVMRKQALPDLIHSIADKKKIPHLRVLNTEGDVHDFRAEPYLLQAYKETTEEGVQCKLLEALGKLHDPALFGWFVQRLNDPSIGIQCFAIWALGELRKSRAIAPLRKKLWSQNRFVQMTAIDAMGKTGQNSEVASELCLFLHDDEVQIRFLAAKALHGTAGIDDAPELMDTLMQEPSLDVQEALAETLGHSGGIVAAGHFIELLKNPPTPATEHWAEVGLAAGQPDIISPLLKPLVESGDFRLRLSAERVLKGFDRKMTP